MTTVLITVMLYVYVAASAMLILYGLHHYVMIWFFLRARKRIRPQNRVALEKYRELGEPKPSVLSQIPLYNEFNVAERVIRAVAAIDYPNHCIQVLDDSTDETREEVDRVVADLAAQGVDTLKSF